MNPVIFMSRVMPHCGGGGNFTELPVVLLTFVIAGVILIILGILANILHVKFSQGFGYTPIHWADIKPTFDNSFLGCLGGILGSIFICTSATVGLVAGVYWCIITL
jgi:hypothetical protein